MVKLIQDLIPASKYSLKAPYSMNAQYITVHNTSNKASAKNEISYMKGNSNATSYHIAVDDEEAIQAIPFNRNAWHCGDGSGSRSGNRTSIGIEICYSTLGGEKYKKAEENAIELIVQMLKERGWGIDRVKYHIQWSGKHCPHRILGEGRGDSFKDEIDRRLKSGTTASSVATPDRGVEQLQTNLALLGIYTEKINGVYDKNTINAVMILQRRKGLVVDGIAGKLTLAKIKELLNEKVEETIGEYRIYTGVFSDEKIAAEFAAKIGYNAYVQDGRIWTGVFTKLSSAEKAHAEILANHGFNPIIRKMK